MQDLTTTTVRPSITERPRMMGNEAYKAIGWFKNKIERDRTGAPRLPMSAMPSAAMRDKIEDRARELAAAMMPAHPEAIRSEVLKIFAVMSSRAGDEGDASFVQSIYAEDLADQPLFAIRAAGAAFRQGSAGDGKWAPTPAEMLREVRKHTKPFTDELADLRTIASAKALPAPEKPVSAAERANIIAATLKKIREVVDDTAAFPPPHLSRDCRNNAAERARACVRLAEMEIDGWTPDRIYPFDAMRAQR